MRTFRSPTIACSVLLVCAVMALRASARSEPVMAVDVLVYGATSAGVIAAYTARQYGHSVLLVEPGRHVGGMSSGGLGHTDIGNKYAVTGLALDFYRRLGRYYGRLEAWQFEPKAAEQVFESYLDEAGIEVLFSRRVTGVENTGARLRSATFEYAVGTGRSPDLTIAAAQFIDASYEGDLMKRAGVSWTMGREAASEYGETHNGVQVMTGHQFPDGVDPYTGPGDPSSGLLPEISASGVAPQGTGDRKVQAYNFRMTLCQDERRLPLEPPAGYEPARYELLIRLMAARPWKSLSDGFIISRMPNGKTDWNNRGAFSTDYIGRNWEYPDADYEHRARLWRDHETYQKGLLHFIATDPRIPPHIRTEMESWGICRDEFLDTAGWPHQLYVREARRLVGEYVMTEHNAWGAATVEDGVGMAAYTMDSHNVQRVDMGGMVKNEGNVEIGGFPPYPIAYRSITPKRTEATNLLVPVALSATHIVYGSIRMEPVFMVLGQAAAVASSAAIAARVPVQDVNVRGLQRELRANPLADGSTPDVLIDEADADRVKLTGRWSPFDISGRYGPSVLRSEGPGATARFVPEVDVAATYDVYLYWPAADAVARRAPVAIRHAEGTTELGVDLPREAEALQHGIVSWRPLGRFRFEPGREAWVEVRSDGADGAVLADAVLLVPHRGR